MHNKINQNVTTDYSLFFQSCNSLCSVNKISVCDSDRQEDRHYHNHHAKARLKLMVLFHQNNKLKIQTNMSCTHLTSAASSASSTKKASPASPSFICRSAGSPLISISTCKQQLMQAGKISQTQL